MKPTQEQILSAINKLVRENRITQMSKVSRIDLGLADDVEKLTQQAKALIPELTKQKKRIDSIEKLSVQASKDREKKKDNSKKAADKYFDLQDKYEKASSFYDTAEKELKSAMDYLITLDKEIKKATGVIDKEKSKAGKLSKTLEKKLDTLEKAAKDLGVKIPTGDASKVLKKLISLL